MTARAGMIAEERPMHRIPDVTMSFGARLGMDAILDGK